MTPLSSALEGELRKVSEYRAKLHRTIRMNWTKWNEWMKEWMNAWNEWWVTDERTSDVFSYCTLYINRHAKVWNQRLFDVLAWVWTHDLLLGGQGPIFRRSQKLSRLEIKYSNKNVKNKIAQVLANKPVHYIFLTDNFITLPTKVLKPLSWM